MTSSSNYNDEKYRKGGRPCCDAVNLVEKAKNNFPAERLDGATTCFTAVSITLCWTLNVCCGKAISASWSGLCAIFAGGMAFLFSTASVNQQFERARLETKKVGWETKMGQWETKKVGWETKMGRWETKMGRWETKMGRLELQSLGKNMRAIEQHLYRSQAPGSSSTEQQAGSQQQMAEINTYIQSCQNEIDNCQNEINKCQDEIVKCQNEILAIEQTIAAIGTNTTTSDDYNNFPETNNNNDLA